MRKLVGVLIGCGAISREHLGAVAQIEAVDVAAVCDVSPARAEATAERFGIAKWYTSHASLLSEIRPDLVHITTPPISHAAIATDCLMAGLNVLCEKPLTAKYSEFAPLKRLALERRCMLMENQQFRFHSSVRRLQQFLASGELGDLLEVHICISLNITATGSPYVDPSVPHFGLSLAGGVIGDFLPHMAYLAHMFAGPIVDVRTTWAKHKIATPLPADEFRGLMRGDRATAYLSFSGNAGPDAFLVRLIGTRMRVESNLFEPPRLTTKRTRRGEPALMSFVDGVVESGDVFKGSFAGLYRKLGGISSYDGLPEFIAETYRALELGQPQPIGLDEIEEIVSLVDRLATLEFKI